jgi:hypothetical protein
MRRARGEEGHAVIPHGLTLNCGLISGCLFPERTREVIDIDGYRRSAGCTLPPLPTSGYVFVIGVGGTGLFADDEGVAGGVAFLVGAVPEDAISGQGSFAWNASGEEYLEAVAGPFGVAGEGVWRAEDGAAVGAEFVEKEGLVQADLVCGSARRSIQIVGGDEKDVGIDRADADSVAAHDLKLFAVDFLERDGLRGLVGADPVGVLHVGGEDGVGVDRAVERVDIHRGKQSGVFRRSGGSGPDLPVFSIEFQIGDVRIVGRPEGLVDVRACDVARMAGVEFVEDDGTLGAGLGIGARVQEELAVMGERRFRTGRRGSFSNLAAHDDDAGGGIEIGDGNRRMKIGDGIENGELFLLLFLLFGVWSLVGDVVRGVELIFLAKLGKFLGVTQAAALELSDLGVGDKDAEGVLGVGHRVRARFAGEFHGDSCAGAVVLGVVGPGSAGIVGSDFRGIENDRGIIGTIETFGAFHSEAERPVGLVAVREDEDGVMVRDRGRNGLLCRRLRGDRGWLWSDGDGFLGRSLPCNLD